MWRCSSSAMPDKFWLGTGYLAILSKNHPWSWEPEPEPEPHSCRSLPKTEVTFSGPWTKTAGAGPGRLVRAYEYGNCIDRADYVEKTTMSGAMDTRVGF